MHTYSINSDKRVKVILMMILISIIITPGFNFFLNKMVSFVSNNDALKNIIEIIDSFGYNIKQFSVLFIFGIIYFFYDRYLWKIKIFKLKFSSIPNLSGVWNGQYKSSWKDTTGNVSLHIKQTWTKIQIISYNEKSKSYSKVASLLYDTNKNVELIFEYENEPDGNREKAMNPHKGFSELIYNEELNRLEGYYTSDQRTRKTHGDIWYKK